MATCPRCNSRAGKRYCPALDTQICAVCCARDRMLEIQCPESCQYLISGRENAIAREQETRQREADRSSTRIPALSRRQLQIVALIEWTIVQAQRQVYQSVADSEVLAAVENALRNLETEDSGVIYQHREFSGVVDDISGRIRDAFEKLGEEVPAEVRPKRGEVITALKHIRESAQSHLARGDTRSFIRFIAQFYPWNEENRRTTIVTP